MKSMIDLAGKLEPKMRCIRNLGQEIKVSNMVAEVVPFSLSGRLESPLIFPT